MGPVLKAVLRVSKASCALGFQDRDLGCEQTEILDEATIKVGES